MSMWHTHTFVQKSSMWCPSTTACRSPLLLPPPVLPVVSLPEPPTPALPLDLSPLTPGVPGLRVSAAACSLLLTSAGPHSLGAPPASLLRCPPDGPPPCTPSASCQPGAEILGCAAGVNELAAASPLPRASSATGAGREAELGFRLSSPASGDWSMRRSAGDCSSAWCKTHTVGADSAGQSYEAKQNAAHRPVCRHHPQGLNT